jgi:hypothetical protein
MSIVVLWSNHGYKICTRNCCVTQWLIPAAYRLVQLAQIVSLRRVPLICRLSEFNTVLWNCFGSILVYWYPDMVVCISCHLYRFMKHHDILIIHKWWSDNTCWTSSLHSGWLIWVTWPGPLLYQSAPLDWDVGRYSLTETRLSWPCGYLYPPGLSLHMIDR